MTTPLLSAMGVRPAAIPTVGSNSPSGGVQFSSALDQALRAVSQTGADATRLQNQFMAGDPGTTLEQTMVAMQKSQISFQSALTVRDRLVSAYTDIMNMAV